MITLDVESRGTIDLIKQGAFRYWPHPRTEVILLGWGDDKKVELLTMEQLWTDSEVRARIESGEKIVVHNLQFEVLAYLYGLEKKYGWKPLDWENQVIDTAAMARAMALPGHLDELARCLQYNLQLPVNGKDLEGRQLMFKFCKPNKSGDFYWHHEDYKRLGDYCKRDVELTQFILPLLRMLPEDEHRQMIYTERMNRRGVRLDVELAELLTTMADEEKADIDARIYELTNGSVPGATKVAKLKSWLRGRMGKDYPTLGADVIREMLEEEELPDNVREILELRLLGAKTSVSKIAKLLGAADPEDDRIRGMFIYCGAGATGRWSSRIVQLHNLPRSGYGRNTEDVIGVIKETGAEGLRMLFPTVMDELPKMIRSLIIPGEGKKFIGGDFAGIEARVLAWLAGDMKRLRAFRKGKDLYKIAADAIGHPGKRQLGKTAELALGYAGGTGALTSMARKFGIKLKSSEQPRMVKGWRDANPRIVNFWDDVEDAALRALRAPDRLSKVNNHTSLAYYFDKYNLWCRLPSGRYICNPYAKLEMEDGPHGSEEVITCIRGNRRPKAGEAEWPRLRLWRGILVENITQAVAADLMRWAIERMEFAQYPPVMHVHDEIVLEVSLDVRLENVEKELQNTTLPTWADGLPFAMDWWTGFRYQK